MLKFLKYLLKTTLFWLLTFAFYRLIFILFNLSYSAGAPIDVLAKSFWVGLRLDISMTGYILLLVSFLQAVKILFVRKFTYQLLHWVNYIIMVLFTALLLANINLYSYWGRLLDAEGFSFLKTPWVIFASVSWYESLLFIIIWLGLSGGGIYLYKRLTGKTFCINNFSPMASSIASFLVLLIAALLIIPIRGGFGVASNNTGVAYFSQYNFANHVAVNPLWNLFYSFKRMDARTHHYSFMEDNEALKIFNEMKSAEGDSTLQVLKKDRPNVVLILMESFSAQVVGALGGEQVTPNLDSLAKEGILFSNIYAASDRSDKGLVATIAGYQVLPGYSIIQYPEKAQSLSFLPRELKEAGYGNLTYMYGGDMGFKGMNSFVVLAGFEEVIAIDDFPASTRGKKWGVHDEYTFDRLLAEMENSSREEKPFFKYFFTLSSHEPFDVPMERVNSDPYLNSVYYTDRCLGRFIEGVKAKGLWDNTLFVLIADHGTPGPAKATSQMKERYHIPMIWAGGALAAGDTVVATVGSQKDMVATLLNQLSIPSEKFTFSRDLLSPAAGEYAFFTYSDAFGYITAGSYQVYDNAAKRYLVTEGDVSPLDSVRGKACLQVVSADHLKR
jgi:phosphoglycerol transferase MdoB-like AlkP superfamily enzyme